MSETCNPVEAVVDEIALDDELAQDKEAEADKQARWSYFVVSQVEFEGATKNDAKKWLSANGVEGKTIIRGRVLLAGEKVVRRITID